MINFQHRWWPTSNPPLFHNRPKQLSAIIFVNCLQSTSCHLFLVTVASHLRWLSSTNFSLLLFDDRRLPFPTIIFDDRQQFASNNHFSGNRYRPTSDHPFLVTTVGQLWPLSLMIVSCGHQWSLLVISSYYSLMTVDHPLTIMCSRTTFYCNKN